MGGERGKYLCGGVLALVNVIITCEFKRTTHSALPKLLGSVVTFYLLYFKNKEPEVGF